VIARYKHSSLFGLIISNEAKKFYNIDTIKIMFKTIQLSPKLGGGINRNVEDRRK
jgi:hypothetical protein